MKQKNMRICYIMVICLYFLFAAQISAQDNSLTAEEIVLERITDAASNNTLILTGLDLDIIPQAVFELTNLSVLNLSDNHLTTLPPAISNLYQLHVLILNNNQITAIPPEIQALEQLSVFEIRNNQITYLPDEITLLSNLCRLDISSNLLTTLPDNIWLLDNLAGSVACTDLDGTKRNGFFISHNPFNAPIDAYENADTMTLLYYLEFRQQPFPVKSFLALITVFTVIIGSMFLFIKLTNKSKINNFNV